MRIILVDLVLLCLMLAPSYVYTSTHVEVVPDSLAVTITCYQPVESQCDADPLITANGSHIDLAKLKEGSLRWVAISRDLRSKFPYGSTIQLDIPNCPERSGSYQVVDCMNPRFTNRVDILVHPEHRCGKWEGNIVLL